MDPNLQLSRSSMHSCSSIGYFVRSMSHATVEVILGTQQPSKSKLNIQQYSCFLTCTYLWKLTSTQQHVFKNHLCSETKLLYYLLRAVSVM